MRLVNRNCVVIEIEGEAPIVIGPFKKFITAVERRDEIVEHLLDTLEIEDGEDYHIQAIGCHSTKTTNDEIDQMVEGLVERSVSE